MRRALFWIAIAAALSSCSEEFKPESFVAGLRVLGVRSEPAELHPGTTAQLTALVVDPSAPGRANTLLWLACDPDPFDLGRTACSDVDTLADPTRIFEAGDGGTPQLPPGMRVIGLGEGAAYAPPGDLFSVLPEGDARRMSGAVAQVLLFAIGEAPPMPTQEAIDAMLARVRSKETASVVTLFRIRVSEQSPLNANPELGEVRLDGEPIPEGAHVALRPREQAVVDVVAPPESYETYQQVLADGVETRTERLIAAAYATGGEFSEDRVALGSDVRMIYAAPSGEDDDPLPEAGTGRVWVVLRDTRGGVVWRALPMHLCEPIGPAPAVASVSPAEIAAGSPQAVALEGTSLDRVLDVFIGPAALQQLAFDGAALRGRVVLPAGEHPVRVKAKDCAAYDTGHVIRAR